MPADLKNVRPEIAVIGSGFAGISAAAYLAKAGCSVDVFEKNDTIGGRARQFHTNNGYVFDMGPSWYWMPEVFEKFFADFGHKPSDFYQLQLLDPGFSIIYGKNDVLDIPANFDQLTDLFESIEKGSADKLKKFMAEASYKYNIGMGKLVYKPGLSLWEFADASLIKGLFKLQVFTSFSKHVRKYFKDPRLIALMEFPVLFLGAMPQETPALYSLMNYAGLCLGTWYPQGGFGKVINAMKQVAEEQGVTFHIGDEVNKFMIEDSNIKRLITQKHIKSYKGVIAAADYCYVEKNLLNWEYRNYSEEYWDKRVMAPSALIFYVGVKKKVNKLRHHNLFFDEDLQEHAQEIYKQPAWPQKPLFYVCCTSKTDASAAPVGHENLFILMPLAVGLEDSDEMREQYFELIMNRLEDYTTENIRNAMDYKKSYCIKDFMQDYHAYKGNAYGLANTLMQTAHLKPSVRNKSIGNLFYAGQLTVPGPGVPPAIISGQIAAGQLLKHLEGTI